MTHNPESSQQPQSSLMALPDDIFNYILSMAPQLGTGCKKLYCRLPPESVRSKHLGITFLSQHSKPENLVKIIHDGMTFSYHVPSNTTAYKWNGIKPSPHSAGGRCIDECDFCQKPDDKTTIVGDSYTGGVLFVCPQCKRGLTHCMSEIMGEHLWKLVDGEKQVMVPRSNGSNEMWFLGSRLPTIHCGKWHLHVQSHSNLLNDSCLSKVVPVEILNELNKA